MNMASTLILFLLHALILVKVDSITFGIIRNVTLDIIGVAAKPFNGTCNDCVCKITSDSTFVSFNCFHGNLTCELHSASDQGKPFTLAASVNTSFYFLSLPTFVTTQSTDTCVRELTSTSTGECFESF